MGRPEGAHGFRTSFRTWAEEATQYPPHVLEMPWRTNPERSWTRISARRPPRPAAQA